MCKPFLVLPDNINYYFHHRVSAASNLSTCFKNLLACCGFRVPQARVGPVRENNRSALSPSAIDLAAPHTTIFFGSRFQPSSPSALNPPTFFWISATRTDLLCQTYPRSKEKYVGGCTQTRHDPQNFHCKISFFHAIFLKHELPYETSKYQFKISGPGTMSNF